MEETKGSESDRSLTDSDDERPRAASAVISAQDENDDDENEDGDESDDGGDALDFTQPDYALQLSESQAAAAGDSQDGGEAARVKASAMPARVAQMPAKNIEDLTALLVRYMLYKASLKLPIKFVDISKDVFPKYKNISR